MRSMLISRSSCGWLDLVFSWLLLLGVRDVSIMMQNNHQRPAAAEAFSLAGDRALLSRHRRRVRRCNSRHVLSLSENQEHHPMATNSHLSHVKLNVPSVDKTVAYWKEMGGKVTRSSEKKGTTNGEAELGSAFLELGCYGNSKQTTTKDNTSGSSGTGAVRQATPSTAAAAAVW